MSDTILHSPPMNEEILGNGNGYEAKNESINLCRCSCVEPCLLQIHTSNKHYINEYSSTLARKAITQGSYDLKQYALPEVLTVTKECIQLYCIYQVIYIETYR